MKDYLKYWRVVSQYIKRKHNIRQDTLDMLLFLYSEKYFTKSDFNSYTNIMPWDRNRWVRLREAGWIELWRKRRGRETSIYQLTLKAKRLVGDLYNKLEGDEVPETKWSNPMFRPFVRFTDKVYRLAIIEMNKELKQLKRDLTHAQLKGVRRRAT